MKELPEIYKAATWKFTSPPDGHNHLTAYEGKSIGVVFATSDGDVNLKLGHYSVDQLVKSLCKFLKIEMNPIPPKGFRIVSSPNKVAKGKIKREDRCWNGCAWWHCGESDRDRGSPYCTWLFYCRRISKNITQKHK